MLKADLKKIVYTSPKLEPLKYDDDTKRLESNVLARNFKKLNQPTQKIDRLAMTDYKEKKKNEIKSQNFNSQMRAETEGSLLLPSIKQGRNQNYSLGKRVYKQAKGKEDHITIDYSITETFKTRNDSRKIINYKVSDEYKKMNEKLMCSWDRDFKSHLTGSSKRPVSTMANIEKRHKLGYHMKGVKYDRCKKTGEVKLLLETSLQVEEPLSPSHLKKKLRCISNTSKANNKVVSAIANKRNEEGSRN